MVQSRFHKDDDGDLHEQILRIEAYIEELADVEESCRKIILVSKFAAGAGGILTGGIELRRDFRHVEFVPPLSALPMSSNRRHLLRW
jgi:hypothetical protein